MTRRARGGAAAQSVSQRWWAQPGPVALGRFLALAVPAGVLGGLTLSAALIVGHAEIEQLAPESRRHTWPAQVPASPFRMIAGSEHGPAAAPMPGAVEPSLSPAPAEIPAAGPPPAGAPLGGLFDDPAEIPDASQPGALRQSIDRRVEKLPEPARPAGAEGVAAVYRTVGTALDATGLRGPIREVQRATAPVFATATAATKPVGEAVTAARGLLP